MRSFLNAVGHGELVGDPRFATVGARAQNVKEWFAIRGAPLTDRTTAEWLEILQNADIAVKPCHTLDTLPRDPHLQKVGLIRSDDHPTQGKTLAIRSTISFDASYLPLPSFAQPRGWETHKILEEMGYSSEEIGDLLAEGTVVAGPMCRAAPVA